MAYIYQITNDINGKIYIGKTEFSIEKRFQEHCRDFQKQTEQHRPLYAAMRKYGIEHFHIECLEETDNPEERERYWIEVKGSFKNGYNATIGGDGRRYIDRDKIYLLWKQNLNCKQISAITGHDPGWIEKILKELDVPQKELLNKSKTSVNKSVCQLDKNNNIIFVFDSLYSACREMRNQGLTHCKDGTGAAHISEVCRGKRKTFAGYKWKFLK